VSGGGCLAEVTKAHRAPPPAAHASRLELAARARAERPASVRDLVRWGARRFAAAGLAFGHGTDNARDEALALALAVLGRSPYATDRAVLDEPLSAPEREAVIELFVRRIRERRPAAYLTRRTWFAGLELYVDERVLVPRSPLAEWIERGFSPWLDPARVRRVLDLGTGSGALALACARAFESARIVAADLSGEALEVARMNAARHGLGDRIDCVRSDLFSAIEGRFDLVVSNPPYVRSASLARLPPEYGHEPRLALEGGRDGLDCVRRLLADAGGYLAAGGILAVEVGEARPALEAAFPRLPSIWLDLERGGDNVFLLEAGDLGSGG